VAVQQKVAKAPEACLITIPQYNFDRGMYVHFVSPVSTNDLADINCQFHAGKESIVFEWLERTTVATWVGESLYGYPFMLALHGIGLAIVVGIFAMRDLRLLGLFTGISYDAIDSFRKLAWTGFSINAISGSFLFTSQATVFVSNIPFLLKIAMIFLAAVCAGIIQNRMRNEAADWDSSGAVAAGSVRLLAGLSITFWMGAIIAGRLTAYL